MKLFTHNMLYSKHCLKGVIAGYPLGLIVRKFEIQESEFNRDFTIRWVRKLDWIVFWSAAKQLGHEGSLVPHIILGYEKNETFLRDVHHALFEVNILEGELVCPETNIKFPIIDGTPHMSAPPDCDPSLLPKKNNGSNIEDTPKLLGPKYDPNSVPKDNTCIVIHTVWSCTDNYGGEDSDSSDIEDMEVDC